MVKAHYSNFRIIAATVWCPNFKKFYGYIFIAVCACDPTGAVEEICDKTDGECLCKDNFNGLRCDVCARGYWGFPACVGRYTFISLLAHLSRTLTR